VNERLTHTQDPAVRAAADALLGRLAAIEDSLYNPRLRSSQDPLNFPIRLNNKMAALLGVIESAESAPTRQTYEVFADLSRRIDVQLAALNAVVTTDLPRLNALLRAANLPEVRPEPQHPAPETAPPARSGGGHEQGGDESGARGGDGAGRVTPPLDRSGAAGYHPSAPSRAPRRVLAIAPRYKCAKPLGGPRRSQPPGTLF
jgi:hypothetical protein